MGRPLEQTDDDCPEVWKNIILARSVWGRLGVLVIWEGVDPKVAEMFYRSVIKAVILFGADTWVLLASM